MCPWMCMSCPGRSVDRCAPSPVGPLPQWLQAQRLSAGSTRVLSSHHHRTSCQLCGWGSSEHRRPAAAQRAVAAARTAHARVHLLSERNTDCKTSAEDGCHVTPPRAAWPQQRLGCAVATARCCQQHPCQLCCDPTDAHPEALSLHTRFTHASQRRHPRVGGCSRCERWQTCVQRRSAG